jgi:hypothetical protein
VGVVVVGVVVVVVVAQKVFYISPDLRMSELCKSGSVCISLNRGLMELLSGHEKIITKSGISLNSGTLNWGFTV